MPIPLPHPLAPVKLVCYRRLAAAGRKSTGRSREKRHTLAKTYALGIGGVSHLYRRSYTHPRTIPATIATNSPAPIIRSRILRSGIGLPTRLLAGLPPLAPHGHFGFRHRLILGVIPRIFHATDHDAAKCAGDVSQSCHFTDLHSSNSPSLISLGFFVSHPRLDTRSLWFTVSMHPDCIDAGL